MDYDVAVKQTPSDKKIYNNRAAAKMMLKDYQGALKDFNYAIELDPMYADAYNNRGRVKQYLGDTQGACSDWHTALSLGIDASRDLIIQYCK
jgi:tetratricopeptide (TPR) repeat protein